MTLHEFQARSLTSALALADTSVHRMERLLTEGGEEGVVRFIQDTLSPEERAALIKGVQELRDMLAAMAERFNLQRNAMDIRRVLDAELSTLRVLFEDCRPARMKGYGRYFSPEDGAQLDATVDRLTDHVCAMRTHV